MKILDSNCRIRKKKFIQDIHFHRKKSYFCIKILGYVIYYQSID